MKQPIKCHTCGITYDRGLTSQCPYCGTAGPIGTARPKPQDCPEPLCLLDIDNPSICQNCPRKPKPHPGWGGKRPGAGAPAFNLNRLTHGQQSRLIKLAVEKLAEDPELRAFLLLIARAATEGEIPETTKRIITKALGKTPLRREAATIRLKRMREGVSHA